MRDVSVVQEWIVIVVSVNVHVLHKRKSRDMRNDTGIRLQVVVVVGRRENPTLATLPPPPPPKLHNTPAAAEATTLTLEKFLEFQKKYSTHCK